MMDRALPIDTTNIKAYPRVTIVDFIVVGTEDRTEATAGTGACTRVEVILPTPQIPKSDSGRSSETRRIMTERGQDDSRERGEVNWG